VGTTVTFTIADGGSVTTHGERDHRGPGRGGRGGPREPDSGALDVDAAPARCAAAGRRAPEPKTRDGPYFLSGTSSETQELKSVSPGFRVRGR
jgi:hypothetical protein